MNKTLRFLVLDVSLGLRLLQKESGRSFLHTRYSIAQLCSGCSIYLHTVNEIDMSTTGGRYRMWCARRMVSGVLLVASIF